ncbi:hypothetical protein Tco_0428608 [Tanacetum coccineum]
MLALGAKGHKMPGNRSLDRLRGFKIKRVHQTQGSRSARGLSRSVRMPPKRTSTSEAPAMTQATIRKVVADSVATALEAQAATMAIADNTNRNIGER